MTITVRLFASYADALAAPTLPLQLGERATVGDLRLALRRRPELAGLPLRPLIAVNQRYAPDDLVIGAGDEVAVIPPVAGG